MIHIVHHDDLDGECAAAVAMHFSDALRLGYRLIQKTYDSPLNVKDSKFKPDDVVYIVDYSIPPEALIALSEKVKKVIMIDHHKTTIERYEDFDYSGPGIIAIHLDESMAACELAYIKLSRKAESAQEAISWPAIKDRSGLPRFIRLLGDFDTYKFRFGNETRQFHWGMMARETRPDSYFWYDLMNDSIGIRQICSGGEIISRYQDIRDERDVLSRGFFAEWEGYKCFIFNGDRGGGKLKKAAPSADIWISFRLVNETTWEISLYSKAEAVGGVDVSKIAEKFWYNNVQGGGHPGASGFVCAYPPFLLKGE